MKPTSLLKSMPCTDTASVYKSSENKSAARADEIGFLSYPNADFTGNDIGSQSAGDPDACAAACYDNVSCIAFTFSPSSSGEVKATSGVCMPNSVASV